MNKSKEFLYRVISSILFIPLLLYALFYDRSLLIFPLILVGSAGWGLFEFYQLIEKTGIRPYRYPGFAGFIIIFYFTYYSIPSTDYLFILSGLILLFGLILYLINRHGSERNLFADIGLTLLGIIYLGWTFSLLIPLHRLESGAWLIVWLILVTWFCDIGAYSIGSIIGKHKLCPTISPGKTIEGLFGGILMSVLVAIIFWRLFHIHLPFGFGWTLLFALILSITGVLGDLAESILKRNAGVKDSGRTFTGHGGMLDIIDSLIFNIPVFYYLLQILL